MLVWYSNPTAARRWTIRSCRNGGRSIWHRGCCCQANNKQTFPNSSGDWGGIKPFHSPKAKYRLRQRAGDDAAQRPIRRITIPKRPPHGWGKKQLREEWAYKRRHPKTTQQRWKQISLAFSSTFGCQISASRLYSKRRQKKLPCRRWRLQHRIDSLPRFCSLCLLPSHHRCASPGHAAKSQQ